MNKIMYILVLLLLAMSGMATAKPLAGKSTIKTMDITYTGQGVILKGYVAFDSSKKAERPAVIVVPEWWGSGDYVRMRARQLAEMGYLAFAADIYGGGKQAADPKEAGELAMPFYTDPSLANQRLQAAIDRVKLFPETNQTKIGAIGFCFGGSLLLNAAKMGMPFTAVVSFHGGLNGVPAVQGSTKAKLLICHGEADSFISASDITKFQQNLDDVKVPYTFLTYKNATHAFTNPNATAMGKKFKMPIAYNQEAEKKSWADMSRFLKDAFQ